MTNLTNLIQPADDETMARQRIEDSPLNSKGFQRANNIPRTKSGDFYTIIMQVKEPNASPNEHISPGY